MNRAIYTAILFLFCLVPSAAALAQAPVSPAAPPSAEKIRLVQEMYRVMEFDDLMNQMTVNMLDQMDPLRGRVVSKQDEAFFERLKGSMKRGMARLVPEMMAATTEIYARTFTEQELRDVISFYSSASGRAFLHKGKMVMAEAMTAMNTVIPKYVAYTEEDYCAQVTCGDTERRLFGNMQKGVDISTGRKPLAE